MDNTATSTKIFEFSTFATARLTGTMVTLADLEEPISGVVIAREAWRKLHTFVTAVKAMACSFSSQNQQHRVKVHRKLDFAGKIERMHSHFGWHGRLKRPGWQLPRGRWQRHRWQASQEQLVFGYKEEVDEEVGLQIYH